MLLFAQYQPRGWYWANNSIFYGEYNRCHEF